MCLAATQQVMSMVVRYLTVFPSYWSPTAKPLTTLYEVDEIQCTQTSAEVVHVHDIVTCSVITV